MSAWMPLKTRGYEDATAAPYLRWFRTIAVAMSLVFIIYAIWSWVVHRFWPETSDFVSFWAAGRLAMAGQPQLAYDISAHHAAEQAVGRVGGLLPFPYPPPFLAVVALFALLPFGPAFFAWIFATAGLYISAARRVAPLPFTLAIPAAYINLVIGQNGFLTSGIFISGLLLIETSPWVAGTILGFLTLKPQLALLLPVAMLAGREWRVIGGAAITGCLLVTASLLLFGWQSYQAFFDILPRYVALLRDSRLPWSEFASPFALARFVGVPAMPALLAHSAIAAVATILTSRAWWLRLPQRAPVLATASILVTPYMLTYDALLLIVPIGWMIAVRRYPYALASAWMCAFVPIISYYTPVPLPNLTSIAAIICLWRLHRQPQSAPSAKLQPA